MNSNNSNSIIEELILALPCVYAYHAPGSKLYGLLKKIARKEIENLFNSPKAKIKKFGPFGDIAFPYYNMGSIDSLDLFGLDELIIFSFYWTNRKIYKKVLDVGANIGLHSVILDKCGFEVRSYEPDPTHFEVLKKDLALNSCSKVRVFNAAVSNHNGLMDFVRILGNTTGSHLAGSKADPYGELEKFSVKVKAFEPLIKWADLIKLDVEGHEKEVLLSTKHEHWLKTDALVEIENKDNAVSIFEHFKRIGVKLFSQKSNWNQVQTIKDMPISYHEGTLFITTKSQMPWHRGIYR